MRHGGLALFNGVLFYSKNVKAKAIKKNGKLTVTHTISHITPVRKKTIGFKIDQFLGNLPFIRGAWLMLKTFLTAWKLLIFLFVISFLYLFLFTPDITNDSSYFNIEYYFYVISICMILIVAFYITKLGKYHAAEHMTSNCYLNDLELTVENVRKQSRIHRACGTNLVTFLLLVSFVLWIIPYTRDINELLEIIITWSISYELFIIEDKRVKKFLKPIYQIGSFLQYVVFTSKPNDEQLIVAIASFKTMERYQKEWNDKKNINKI